MHMLVGAVLCWVAVVGVQVDGWMGTIDERHPPVRRRRPPSVQRTTATDAS